MKFIFSLLFVFSSYFSFCQMTINEMMKLYEMDLDEFETYALGKGYELHQIKNNENINGVVYIKNPGLYPNYLELDISNVYRGRFVSFQTSNNSEFLSLKNQIKILGFKLFNDNNSLFDQKESKIIRQYKNKKWLVVIFQGTQDSDVHSFRVDLLKL